LQCFVNALAQYVCINVRFVNNTLDGAAGLLDECEEQVFRVELRVTVALDYFMCARECVLGAFGESIESHHSLFLLSGLIITATQYDVNDTLHKRLRKGIMKGFLPHRRLLVTICQV
jgi:hypothetical protein